MNAIQVEVEFSSEFDDSLIEICLTLERQIGVARLEKIVPICVATLLAMVAPLAGPFKWQLFVKIVALLFQYLALQDLIGSNFSLHVKDETPRLGMASKPNFSVASKRFFFLGFARICWDLLNLL